MAPKLLRLQFPRVDEGIYICVLYAVHSYLVKEGQYVKEVFYLMPQMVN